MLATSLVLYSTPDNGSPRWRRRRILCFLFLPFLQLSHVFRCGSTALSIRLPHSTQSPALARSFRTVRRARLDFLRHRSHSNAFSFEFRGFPHSTQRRKRTYLRYFFMLTALRTIRLYSFLSAATSLENTPPWSIERS